MLAFTDNVVMGIPVDDECDTGVGPEDQGKLELTPICVGLYQFFNALQGVPLRGGIARGDLFISNSFATGKAILHAYVLESSVATVPRVAVEAEVITAVISECERSMRNRPRQWRARPMPTIERVVLVDCEGDVAFLHYLAAPPSDEVNGATVATHRAVLQKGLHQSDGNVRAK
jgi:hypothetical protein